MQSFGIHFGILIRLPTSGAVKAISRHHISFMSVGVGLERRVVTSCDAVAIQNRTLSKIYRLEAKEGFRLDVGLSAIIAKPAP